MDKRRVRAAVSELLLAIGEDPSRPGLCRTPDLVADAFADIFGGVGKDPQDFLGECIPSDEVSGPIVLKDVPFRSVCEHHLLPFTGKVNLLYEPGNRIAGLGSFHALVECAAARPQIQERLGEDIAEAIYRGLDAKAVLVMVTAKHGCLFARAHRSYSEVSTFASRGFDRGKVLEMVSSFQSLL